MIYEEGKPVGIHYDMLGLLAIEAAKFLAEKYQGLEARVAELEG